MKQQYMQRDQDRFYPSSSQSGLDKKRARSLQSKRKKSVQKDHPSFQPIERDQEEEGWRHLLVEVKMAIRTIG